MFKVHEPRLINVGELNPAVYNPRSITPEKFDALKKSISVDGFVENIVVQKKGMCIIAGHQRVRAVRELAVAEGKAPPPIPCVVLDIPDQLAKKLNVKLNKVRGDFEARPLGELLIDIRDDEPFTEDDALDLGFTLPEAEKFIHIVEPAPVIGGDDGGKEFGRSITLSIEFSTIEARDKIKKLLAERSNIESKKSGDIVAHLLTAKPVKKRTIEAVKSKRRKVA